jgi:hypothetical protein
MNDDGRTVRISYAPIADKYRDHRTEELLREAGFIRADDGTWHPPSDTA